VLPTEHATAPDALPAVLDGFAFITVIPTAMHASVLARIDRVIAVGADPDRVVREFCAARDLAYPAGGGALAQGEMLTLSVNDGRLRRMLIIPGKGTQLRHRRKYAAGKLGDDKSFFFRGPDNKLNLKAQNLSVFMDLADGVDEETWSFHRDQGDYSSWIGSAIKDADLSRDVAEAEQSALSAPHAKAAIREAIERRYTLPAEKSS
jgi:hypothetical protein